ncbi:LysR family transcriptional regulator [Asaia astilbis]|uniref:LysR family transcriptional regulator n=1 Tax=Asaia astilbis TaxID=610244 RepID=UPI000A4B00A1|nr:LysR family transcriptional regulator [Asaia astilbis]
MADAPSHAPQRQARRMATNMPTELIRSFVAIVDAGSMAQATETIFLTQSALSLQMKRLEDLLQQKLFRRDGRALALTAAGEDLLVRARQFLALNDQIVQSMGQGFDPEPIHIGMTQDYADTVLPMCWPASITRIHEPAFVCMSAARSICSNFLIAASWTLCSGLDAMPSGPTAN